MVILAVTSVPSYAKSALSPLVDFGWLQIKMV